MQRVGYNLQMKFYLTFIMTFLFIRSVFSILTKVVMFGGGRSQPLPAAK